MTTTPPPAVGQVWQDADPRSSGRHVRIVAIDDTHATVEQITYNARERIAATLPDARRTRIRLNRLRPTSSGYRYVG